MDLPLLHYFKEPAVSSIFLQRLLQRLSSISDALESIEKVETELRFNIQCSKELSENDNQILKWVLSETFERSKFSSKSFLESKKKDFEMSQPQLHATIFEVGPRLSFTTAWSTNAVTIFNVCGIDSIKRIEKSTRYLVVSKLKLERQDIDALLDEIHDKMTECEYTSPLLSFKIQHKEQPTINVPLLERGREALEEINKELGLAFDEQDIDLYLNMFKEMKRNPTSVELFDMAQSNSEHSRHWFFRGRIVIDGKEMPDSLMSIVKQTLGKDTNSVLAFCDNASAIKGREVELLLPKETFKSSSLELKKALYHITFTAETHNFPTGVAPFPGAETGTGGRIRDVHAIGKGGLVLAGTAAYCVGNLNIPNYHLPWENSSFKYPNNIAKPLKIIIEASNGASDYGNKFGEPVIQGFCRSFGMHVNKEERREWIKPIMFTGGIGQVDALHLEKGKPEKEMAVIKIGGPAYRIGMGGGAASSIAIHGQNVASLDFNAVQRGDAEMEQKLNRVIRACVEMGEDNPIVSIHDQGAGGSGNVLKEIVDPEGAKINIRKMVVGDETLSVLELWGAEYQENDAVLIRPKHLELFDQICKRERLPYAVVGIVTGDGKIVVYDEKDNSTPVNLDLEKVLGKMPPKTFHSQKLNKNLKPLVLPENITIKESLERVLRLVSVGSKLFLTNKVDRSVTGLIAQQQCVGPLQLPLSNVAVIAQSHLTTSGAALSIGEQPIKGLINSSAMARMSIGEMLTNIVWAKLSDLQDIKCSGNWMWAAKLPGEGSEMYEAAVAMRDLMKELNIGIDGGKDSLSMAAKLNHETIKAPGMLTISGYATCPDITKVITPDIKYPGASNIYFIDLGEKKDRMGGSSLAHVFNQIGDQSPDVVSVDNLRNSFNAVQLLIERGMISCGHDRSDGGLIVSLLEMAFAGNCGVAIKVKKERISSTSTPSIINFFFNEELGLLFEVPKNKEQQVQEFLHQSKIEYEKITIEVQSEDSNTLIMQEEMVHLRDIWNETSHQLELLQANPKCVHEETSFLKNRKGISYNIPFHPENTASSLLNRISDLKPKVAVIREEGTNGDREMLTSLYMAGFEAWDVSMSDLTQNKIQLDLFKGVVLPGGFSFGDVTGSSKGWAAAIRFAREGQVWNQFQSFYERKDTWSLGVCNGCQLMALLGWVPMQGLSDDTQPRFLHNESGRFESRFSLVKILESPAILLKGMENSVIGVWVAHGEGRAYFPSKDILDKVLNDKLAPIRYVDDDHLITEQYPFNPNGSPLGIASLCSPDGRHLAIMPHPERSVLKWQWPYHTSVSSSHVTSPWMKLFQNAREFSESQ